MVARRTNGRERHLGVARDGRERRVDRRPGGESRRLHGSGHEVRVRVEPPAAARLGIGERGDVLRVVDTRQIRIGGRLGDPLDEAAAGCIADACSRRLAASGTLGMAGRGVRIGARIGQEQDGAGHRRRYRPIIRISCSVISNSPYMTIASVNELITRSPGVMTIANKTISRTTQRRRLERKA